MGSGISQSHKSPPIFHSISTEYCNKRLSLQAIIGDHFGKYASYINLISEEEATSFSKISAYILKEAKTENEKCFLAYLFVKARIPFDNGLYSQIPIQPEIRILENILKQKRALSWGVANVYQKICQLMGIQCQIVSGFSKLFFLTNDFKTPNHWWNVVKIENDWFIVDISCASYAAVSGSFENHWYLMAPEISIYNQFSIKNLNLVKENIELNQFIELPSLGVKYFEYGCTIEKDFIKYRYKTKDSFSIKLKIENDKYKVKCSLTCQSMEVTNLNDRTFVENLSSISVEIKAVFPIKGIYELKTEAALKDSYDYFHMFSVLIEYTGLENKYLSFPSPNNFDILFHEPKSHYIEKQTLVKYDVSASAKINKIFVTCYSSQNSIELKLIDVEKNRFVGEAYLSSNDSFVIFRAMENENATEIEFQAIDSQGPKNLTPDLINYYERAIIRPYFKKLQCEVISPKDPIFSDSIYILQFKCKSNVDINIELTSPDPSISYPYSRCQEITYLEDKFVIKFAPLVPGKYNIYVFLGDKDDPAQYGRDGSYSLDLEYVGSPQKIGFPFISTTLDGGLKVDEPLNGFIKVGKIKFRVWAPKALKMAVVDVADYFYLEKIGEWFVGEADIKRADIDYYVKVQIDSNDEYGFNWETVAVYTSYKE